MNITPAILPHDFGELTEKLSRIEGFTSRVQIDLCDGVFGREKTWFPDGSETLPSGFSYEFDLMINDWKKYLPLCIVLGATRIVAHVDTFSDEDLKTLVDIISPKKLSLGISISNDKSVDVHIDMIRKIREIYDDIFIQVMGIHVIGEQGQGFNEEALARVKAIKEQFSNISVQVDGGIKPEIAHKVQEEGADTVVVGSYLFGADDISSVLEALNLAVADQ